MLVINPNQQPDPKLLEERVAAVLLAAKNYWRSYGWPLLYRCSKCLTAAFGWGSTVAAWEQSDECKQYRAQTRSSYASGRMRLTIEEIQERLKRAEAR